MKRGHMICLRSTRRTPAACTCVVALTGAFAAGPACAQSNSVTVTINLTITATATVDVAKVQAATKSAIQGLMSTRANLLTTSGPDTARAHARLGGGSLFGGSGGSGSDGPAAGFADGARGIERPRGGIGAFGGTRASLGYGGQRGSTGLGGGSLGSGGIPGTSIGSGYSSGAGNGMESSAFGGTDRLGQFGRGAGGGLGFGVESSNGFGGPFGVPFGWQREYSDGAGGNTRSAASPFRFSGNAEEGSGRFSFATSLGQMRAAAEAQDQAKQDQAKRASAGMSTLGAQPLGQDVPASSASPGVPAHRQAALGLGSGQGRVAPAAANRPGSIDVWAEGTSSYFATTTIDGRRQGHAAVAHAGADMILMPGLLVGVMGSHDWMADSSSASGQNTGLNRDGRGWMAGPYMSARLTNTLYFDARAAWGQSTNHVDPLGTYVDTFATTRALASAKLTGDWSRDAWRFRPSAEVIWFTETQKAYTNAIGIDIASNTFSLGRTVFGPEVGYRMMLADKSVVEPFVGLKGVWDFARTQETTAAGTPFDSGSVRGRIEAGLSFRAPNGVSIRGSGAYDGLGSSGYHAVQGQARLVVPLQ
ncbi:MAG: autotransporter outer membrane beta-barrel domain-containing protein [Xanthobacteraceae bacterium]|nr:autotransporter outer membrane beta-barrel domain-containing protein [Xanthobacteraceae bacterium]